MKFRKFKRTMLLIEKVVQALILPSWLLLMMWWFYEAGENNEQSLIIILGIPLCLISSAIIGGLLIGISKAITWIAKYLFNN